MAFYLNYNVENHFLQFCFCNSKQNKVKMFLYHASKPLILTKMSVVWMFDMVDQANLYIDINPRLREETFVGLSQENSPGISVNDRSKSEGWLSCHQSAATVVKV